MSAIILITALALGAPGPKDSSKPSPIVGVWAVESQTHDGKTIPVEGDHVWTFTNDGRMSSRAGSNPTLTWYAYTTDDAAKPSTVDLVPSGKETPVDRYVFKVDGETLTICCKEKGDRPGSIVATKGSGNVIYTLKRIKAKD